jgi:predicted GNAT superfamily acetyltransferase
VDDTGDHLGEEPSATVMAGWRCPTAGRCANVVDMPTGFEIRRARREDLPEAAMLLARVLGFGERDAIPAWLMRTTDGCGGVTLVAEHDGAVVGVSYALPARDHALFSCGLAVAPAHRGRDLGAALKAAQRREARALGCSRILWTTDPLNGRALRVYLSGLGAVIVGYRAGLHDGLRADPGHPQDDLEIEWHLVDPPALDRRAMPAVELPWSERGLGERRRVRAEMSALLDDGYLGCDVAIDPAARRCRVEFARRLA